jgi:hypothetical protein
MVTTRKKLGGLEIVDLQTFNQALLSKWYWQCSSPQPKLWKYALDAMYEGPPLQHFMASNFFNSQVKQVMLSVIVSYGGRLAQGMQFHFGFMTGG